MRFARLLPLSCFLLALGTVPVAAQVKMDAPAPGAPPTEAVLGEGYDNAGFNRFFFGSGYRDLWSTPIDVPVLDLDGTGGGLTPVATGGYGQTATLELVGADGLEYAVRSIDKDLTRRLDSLFVGTVVATVVQDQVGQFLPTAGLVVDPLLEANGILHPTHRLVVIPDHPRLGEYREEYAGLIGMFVERPQEGPNGTPGFAGSTSIVGTDRLLEILANGGCERVDAREYLRARLIDMVLGDRDRHEGQWRWARYDTGVGCSIWRPVPEDRDEAFVMNDGFMMSLVRLVRPQQVQFGPDYPSLQGLTYNGWELDRQLLAPLDRAEWRQATADVSTALTDAVIEDAVRRLPPAHYELRGEFLEHSLKSRRDQLAGEADDFYELISSVVELRTTHLAERATLEHRPDGALRVRVTSDDSADGAVLIDRLLDPAVTDEFRLFLGGGDDVVRVTGARGRIQVRAIGGEGDDRFINESEAGSGRTRFYDAFGDNHYEGRAKVDETHYERPAASNLVHRYALDWGGFNRYIPRFGYDPDIGVVGGLSVGVQRYGFRKSPWQSDNVFSAAVGSSGPNAYLGWAGHFRDVLWGADITFDAEYSGLNILRFHGFGNETALDQRSSFYKVEEREFFFSPGVEWSWGQLDRGESQIDLRSLQPILTLNVGPVVKFARTPEDTNSDRFIGTLDPAPLGVGSFGQVGGRINVDYDTRDRRGYASKGLRVSTGGSVFPSIWDVDDTFGEVHGTAAAYLTPGTGRVPTLALRAGAQHVFGDYPYHEAAYVGGSRNLRGFRSGRFAGDSSVFGNAELRIPIASFLLLFPTEFGIHGAADVGRVFFDDDPDGADTWHESFGGGVWFSLLNRSQALSITVMEGDDLTGVYIQAGLHF